MKEPISLFGIRLDAVRMPEAVAQLLAWVASRQGPCRYVVTPNVDHTVMLQHDERFRQAYAEAGLVLADGLPVVLAARLLGRPLPERVPGSDLVPALLSAASTEQPLRIYLLGAAPGVAQRAAGNIQRHWPAVQVAGYYSPPLGFEKDERENAKILAQIAAARPDVLIVGLGAPKQELWVHAHRQQLRVPVALCVGATIDFLAGEKRRAPVWMRRVGLEWLHRMLSEPQRLVRRYGRDAWLFPQLVWQQWRSNPVA